MTGRAIGKGGSREKLGKAGKTEVKAKAAAKVK